MIKISPSILSADFATLGADSLQMQEGSAELLHIDVMDGHFVPNITIGAPVVAALRPKLDKIIFDVHLMISDPLKYIDDFAKAGAEIITIHTECDSPIGQTLELIASKGILPAISVKPNTAAEDAFPWLDQVGMVLVMTVEPGFGGQSFMADMMPKVRKIRNEITRRGLNVSVQVDGGIDLKTAPIAAAAGANILVAGSAIFRSDDRPAMIHTLRDAAEAAYVG